MPRRNVSRITCHATERLAAFGFSAAQRGPEVTKTDWIVAFTHSQLSLGDASRDWETEPGSPAAATDRIADSLNHKGFTIILPRESGHARLGLELLPQRPSFDPEAWDHIVELNLFVPSGRIVIRSPHDLCAFDLSGSPQKPVWDLQPGGYRALVLFGQLSQMRAQLSTASGDDFARHFYGATNPVPADPAALAGYDHYAILLWPVAIEPLKVHKRWEAA